MKPTSKKAISILSISALTLGTAIPAFATPTEPSVEGPSGAGSTDMTMVWQNPNQEYGGTEIEEGQPGYNPASDPSDPTSPGVNLAFKAPTAINFVAKANGDLLAPSASATYIENFSSYGIHVSSMQIEQGSGWNIVADAAAAAGTANAVWGKIGPETEKLDWSGWVGNEKTAVTTPAKWGMSAATASSNEDELHLYTEGKVANLNKDLSSAQTFATIHWYLSNGGTGTEYLEPAEPGKAFGAYSLNELRYISSDIRSKGASSEFYDGDSGFLKYAQDGETLDVVLADGTETIVRLVDASAGRGLVFQFDYNAPIGKAKINPGPYPTYPTSSSAGGWTEFTIRQNINSAEELSLYYAESGSGTESLYSSKLNGMTIGGNVVKPVAISESAPLKSLDYNDGDPQVISTSGDKFWLPSVVEIYGADAWSLLTPSKYTGDEECSQFAYYAKLDPDPTDYKTNPLKATNSSVMWWLRSAYPISGSYCPSITSAGHVSYVSVSGGLDVVPCFCL